VQINKKYEALEDPKLFHFFVFIISSQKHSTICMNPNTQNTIFFDKKPINVFSKFKTKQVHEKQQPTKFNHFKQQNVILTNNHNKIKITS
jgi:hypothetical protein